MPSTDTAHAALGASSSDRWMNCPGSIAMNAALPPGVSGSSIFAAEGTAAHALGERCLMKGQATETYLGLEIEGFEVDEEMAEAVQVYVDHCLSVLKGSGGGRYSSVEQKFSLGILNPPAPMFGTSDFVAYNDVTHLVDVIDLKYGRGVTVEPDNNPQLKYYALGAILALEKEHPGEFPIKTVRLTIVQPRINHPQGMVRSVEVSYDDLLAFTMELMASARATIEPDAPRKAGSWCKWCRAAGVCPDKAEEALAVAKAEFGEVPDPPAPETLSPDELRWTLDHLPALEEWTKQVRSYATEVIEAGGKVPRYKLVGKRAIRKWLDESVLLKWAEENSYGEATMYGEPKLRSPAQLEKKIKKKNVPPELYHSVSSGVTLAPENDMRPAITKGDEFSMLELTDLI